jgi:hypothetical protein
LTDIDGENNDAIFISSSTMTMNKAMNLW